MGSGGKCNVRNGGCGTATAWVRWTGLAVAFLTCLLLAGVASFIVVSLAVQPQGSHLPLCATLCIRTQFQPQASGAQVSAWELNASPLFAHLPSCWCCFFCGNTSPPRSLDHMCRCSNAPQLNMACHPSLQNSTPFTLL